MNYSSSITPTGGISGLKMAVIVEGGLALVALFIAWLFSVPLRDLFATNCSQFIQSLARGFVATLPMLAVFWWLVHSSWPSMLRLRDHVHEFVDEMFHDATAMQLAFVALLAGVGEELLFRGVLQSLVGRWTTPVFALIAVSLLFGLLHAVSRLYFVLATVVGVYFAWLALRFHDLVAPMTAHTLYDFAALVYLSRTGRRVSPPATELELQDGPRNV
jgi:CAAX protease family protein